MIEENPFKDLAQSAVPAAPGQPMPNGEAMLGEEEESDKITQSNILWKPVAHGGGPLVILFPYYNASPVSIYDQEGNLIETGNSTGPSNGYGDTVRFSQTGGAYNNVTVTDSKGTSFFIENGSMRQTF
jgi:hypothetical protein